MEKSVVSYQNYHGLPNSINKSILLSTNVLELKYDNRHEFLYS